MSSLHYDSAWHSGHHQADDTAHERSESAVPVGPVAKPVFFSNVTHSSPAGSAARSSVGSALFGRLIPTELRRVFSLRGDSDEPSLLDFARRVKTIKE